MRRLMYYWAKISSIITTIVFIYYFIVSIEVLYAIVSLGSLTGKSTSIWFYFIPLISLLGIVVAIPLYYYGWVKTPKSKGMKEFAQGITLIYSIFFILGLMINYPLEEGFLYSIKTIIILIPIYYFAWRKPKIRVE